MDNKWLEDFLSVARTGSFSRSAAERHITQPAFSRRIKSLEQWVGTPLIDRSTYPTRLTPAGERFRDAVQLSLATLLEVRHDLRAGYMMNFLYLNHWQPELDNPRGRFVAATNATALRGGQAHVRNIYAKLDVHNKAEALFEARQLGLLKH